MTGELPYASKFGLDSQKTIHQHAININICARTTYHKGASTDTSTAQLRCNLSTVTITTNWQPECCAGLANLISSVLLSLGVALGLPVAEAEEADTETLGAPARLEGPLDVLLLVAAAAEPVGAAAGTVAAMMAHGFMHQARREYGSSEAKLKSTNRPGSEHLVVVARDREGGNHDSIHAVLAMRVLASGWLTV